MLAVLCYIGLFLWTVKSQVLPSQYYNPVHICAGGNDIFMTYICVIIGHAIRHSEFRHKLLLQLLDVLYDRQINVVITEVARALVLMARRNLC